MDTKQTAKAQPIQIGSNQQAIDKYTMGKRNQPARVHAEPVDARSDVATAGDATIDQEEMEVLQVDLGDMVKLKQVLDEAVAGALMEYLPENTAWDNTKLLLMFVACCFACIAQFAPIPFPDSRPILGFCGSAYFAISGILQLIVTFVDRDTILWTNPVDKSSNFKNKALQEHGLNVSSTLPRFSEFFTVKIQLFIKDQTDTDFVSQTWSVGKFFDKEGYFDEVGLAKEVNKLFERFDQGNYDTKSKKD